MKSVILGTAGHVDHGKTVLVEALTGVNTDRWLEERERGITIDLGFARYPALDNDLEISVVDVPGHEDFVKNMLAGATGVDVLLLVVAADEGPMPQTREHLWIARLLGVERGVVALTKADLVDDEWCDLVRESVTEELERIIGPNDWPIVTVSALTGAGLPDLQNEILESALAARARSDDDLFRLPIDRAFTVRGVGTVVTGTVWSGQIESGAEVRILPVEHSARVRGIQVHGRESTHARAGQRAALALVGVERSQASRGHLLVSAPDWRPATQLDAELYVVPDQPRPLKQWQRVRLHLGTAETMARVVLFEREQLRPGEQGLVQLRTEAPVVARAGDRFVVRFYSPVTTLGGGIVLDPWARRRRRLAVGEAERLSAITRAAGADGPRRVVASRPAGVSEAELALLVGLRPPDLRQALEALAVDGSTREIGGRWFSEEAFQDVRAYVLAALGRGHQRDAGARGISLESLRSGIGAPPELVNAGLAELEREGTIRIEAALAALSGHVARLRPDQQAVAEAALARIRVGRLAPPTLKELASALGVRPEELLPVLKFHEERGELVAVTADLYYDCGAINEVREKVKGILGDGRAAAPSELRQALEVSRKYLIPLLEHLDASGFTQRTGEGRVLRRT